ncbi:Uncharacterised protein g9706 [Pycnogonum litorale]
MGKKSRKNNPSKKKGVINKTLVSKVLKTKNKPKIVQKTLKKLSVATKNKTEESNSKFTDLKTKLLRSGDKSSTKSIKVLETKKKVNDVDVGSAAVSFSKLQSS